jgi:hypothetical protein
MQALKWGLSMMQQMTSRALLAYQIWIRNSFLKWLCYEIVNFWGIFSAPIGYVGLRKITWSLFECGFEFTDIFDFECYSSVTPLPLQGWCLWLCIGLLPRPTCKQAFMQAGMPECKHTCTMILFTAKVTKVLRLVRIFFELFYSKIMLQRTLLYLFTVKKLSHVVCF